MDDRHLDSDYDSGIDTDMTSEFESVSSVNYSHREEGGRRYHGYADAPYALPNDEKEQVRLKDIQYCISKLFGKNVLVPIRPSPSMIIDVGTGSGLWAIEVAKAYPTARVIGTDISPTQHTNELPPNCEYRLESILDGLSVDDNSVDLLHSRWLVLGVPTDHWPFYLVEAFRVLKPGAGWIQMLEFDRKGVGKMYPENDSLPKTSALYKYGEVLGSFMSKANFGLDMEQFNMHLEAQGFVDANVKEIYLPIGSWPEDEHLKRVGELAIPLFRDAIDSLEKVYKTNAGDTSPDERKKLFDEARADIQNPAYRLRARMWLITARKPAIPIPIP